MSNDLSRLNSRVLAKLGDAALREGSATLAATFYRTILERAPRATHILSRLGLARRLGSRTEAMLDALEALETIQPLSVFVGDGLATWQKTLPFLDDERFMALAEKHADLLPVANWHWNLQTAAWAVRQARHVEGDLVELGVFRGHTTLFVAEYLDFATWPKTWWLYDTFEGIPDDQVDPGWETSNRKAYAGTFSFEEVRRRFSHIPNITVTKGRVPEILLETAPAKISFMHVDLNNTAAEIAALELLYERVSPGGVILFDDYGWAVSRRQFEAERDWFQRRGLHILPVPTGQGLFVKPAQ